MKNNPPSYITTLSMIHGSMIAACLLLFLLLSYSFSHAPFTGYEWSILGLFVGSLAYFSIARIALFRKKHTLANWMLLIFYEVVSLYALLAWGLNSPAGLFSIILTIILPGILAGARAIIPASIFTIIKLFFVQTIHSLGIITPDFSYHSDPSTFWDVLTYTTIISIFSLIAWLSGRQQEQALARALRAEANLKEQKSLLRTTLAKESTRLRLAQLSQIKELHKFATLGQSTAATLHELSNHLSVLNLDIDDIKQQNHNSQAIENAEESIAHISKMVHQAKQLLVSYEQEEPFNAIPVIEQAFKDNQEKYKKHEIEPIFTRTIKTKYVLSGNALALMQVITVLLNNAIDASAQNTAPKVALDVRRTHTHLKITVTDNGPGVSKALEHSLFEPIHSDKPGGMGIGLYIAHQLVTNLFHGTIESVPNPDGAQFVILLPKASAP